MTVNSSDELHPPLAITGWGQIESAGLEKADDLTIGITDTDVAVEGGYRVGILLQSASAQGGAGPHGQWRAEVLLTRNDALQLGRQLIDAGQQYSEHERDAIRDALDAITCGLAGAWESVDDDLALSSDDQAAVDRLQTILTAIENVYSPQYVQERLDELHGRVVKVTGISDN